MRKVFVVCLLAAIGCGGSSPGSHDGGNAGKKGDGAAGAGGTSGAGGDMTGVAGAGGEGGAGGTAGAGGAGGTAGAGGAGGAGGTAGAGGAGGTAGAGGADAGTTTDSGGDTPIEVGGDTATEAGGDAPKEAGGDTAAEAGGDTAAEAGGDAAVETAPVCGADNTACTVGVAAGLCKSNVCAVCTDVTDDAHCTAAYGTAGTNPYICLNGVCVHGNCRANGDCTGPAGSICGLSQANVCAKCSSDAQCMTSYGATFICTTSGASMGACVSGACATADNTVCTANAADVCCGGACATGGCCPGAAGDTLCKNQLGNSAVCTAGHTCSTCQTVAGKNYIVDPVNGSDSGSTGSGNPTASCSFKTVTRALQFIGAGAVSGTTITIVGGASAGAAVVVKTGETFPIVVPANVTIVGQNFVTVAPPAAQTAFELASPASGLKNLTLDGGAQTAQSGVIVVAGSTDGTTLQDVAASGFLGDGIVVAGGKLTIGSGVSSTDNGTAAQRTNGLHVSNRAGVGGSVSIILPTPNPVSFSNNSGDGILVEGLSSVTIQGVPGTLGAGTVVANGNQNGIVIAQGGATPPLNKLTGIVAWANVGNAGLAVGGGSAVQLRSSYLLSNQTAGVLIVANGANSDISRIDLGTAASAGKNTLQASLGSGPNLGGGVCLGALGGLPQSLTAMGNVFSGPRDCSTATPGTVTGGHVTCTNHVDVSFTTATSDILVDNCAHP